MKLNELHVADLCTRAEGHGDAVSRGSFGIGRVAIELPHASRGQQNRRTSYFFRQSLLTDQRNAVTRWFSVRSSVENSNSSTEIFLRVWTLA